VELEMELEVVGAARAKRRIVVQISKLTFAPELRIAIKFPLAG
jgi:hypothetical protein